MEVWRAAGLRFYPETTERDLAALIGQDLALVDERGGEIAGTVLGSYDGLRGWVHRLATRPDRRGRGIATGLLAELERRLLTLGCAKVNLLIEADNADVTGFYAAAGYRSCELAFMEKWLVPEPDGPARFDPRPAAGAISSPTCGPNRTCSRRGSRRLACPRSRSSAKTRALP